MSPAEWPVITRLPICPGRALAPGIENCATPSFIAASTSLVLMLKATGTSTLSLGMISRGSGETAWVTVGSTGSRLVATEPLSGET